MSSCYLIKVKSGHEYNSNIAYNTHIVIIPNDYLQTPLFTNPYNPRCSWITSSSLRHNTTILHCNSIVMVVVVGRGCCVSCCNAITQGIPTPPSPPDLIWSVVGHRGLYNIAVLLACHIPPGAFNWIWLLLKLYWHTWSLRRGALCISTHPSQGSLLECNNNKEPHQVVFNK